MKTQKGFELICVGAISVSLRTWKRHRPIGKPWATTRELMSAPRTGRRPFHEPTKHPSARRRILDHPGRGRLSQVSHPSPHPQDRSLRGRNAPPHFVEEVYKERDLNRTFRVGRGIGLRHRRNHKSLAVGRKVQIPVAGL